MKLVNSLKVVALITLMASCQKHSDPDPRDSFVGDWIWHYTLSCTTQGTSQIATGSGNSPTTIVKSSSKNGVVITFGSIEVTGYVSAGVLTIGLQTVDATNYQGTANLSNGKLVFSVIEDPTTNIAVNCLSTGSADKQ